jgi:RPA family protein
LVDHFSGAADKWLPHQTKHRWDAKFIAKSEFRSSSRLVFIARLNELELKNSRSDNDFSLSLSLLITKSARLLRVFFLFGTQN